MAIHLVPSFHYDVVYLKSYDEYLEMSLRIIDNALDLLAAESDYTFTIEQVILLEEYWNRRPERRPLLKELAASGRLEIAPGMYVMPDMNMIDGESMFMQVKIGFDWLQRNLGLTPSSCWIADCWGHHAQLPQILSQAGYRYYFFYRCMRRDVMKNHFRWYGIDGTAIPTHWLATGYANLHFPDAGNIENVLELDLAGVTPDSINRLAATIRQYNSGDEPIMICNGGDFCVPQPSAPKIVRHLNRESKTEPIEFSTPSRFMARIDWQQQPEVSGEFNSLFQGSFTANIRIKQRNHQLGNRLQCLEKYAALTGSRADYAELWKILLKQQFHDAICGTIGNRGLEDIHHDFDRLETMLDEEFAKLTPSVRPAAWFNPLPFPRRETVEHQGKRYLADLPPFGFVPVSAALPVDLVNVPIPDAFSNPFYRAEINSQGYIDRLVTADGAELVDRSRCAFGSLVMQMDYGDLWLNFEGPIDGGSPEAAFTANVPDPLERAHADLVNRRSIYPRIKSVTASANEHELVINQQGELNFWTIKVAFTTTVTFSQHSPAIRYRTAFTPQGKHFRVRCAFPTRIENGCTKYEIPYGIQERGTGEHPAMNWMDHTGTAAGLALFNRGIPANNVDNGCLLLTLFRAAAMEYKTASDQSFNENVPHEFNYAIMPHDANPQFAEIVRQARQFCMPPEPAAIPVNSTDADAWQTDAANVLADTLRRRNDQIFLRLYECAGTETETVLTLPAEVTGIATADGLENPQESFRPVGRTCLLHFRPFEIKAFLLQLNS